MFKTIETIRDIQTGLKMDWHRQTRIVPVISPDTSGICYPMERRRLVLDSGVKTNFFAIVSKDDNLPIGNPVGEGYSMISNSKIWEAIEFSLKDISHSILSCGIVQNRSMAFLSIKLDNGFEVQTQKVETALNIIWGHGGRLAVSAKARFNILSSNSSVSLPLEYKNKELSFKFKHTSSADMTLSNMDKAIEAYKESKRDFKAIIDRLATTPINEDRAEFIFAGIIGVGEEELSSRAINTVGRLVELFYNGKGNKGESLFDVFNSLMDYFSHESSGGDNKWKQYESSEFGSASARKNDIYDLFSGKIVSGYGSLEDVEAKGKGFIASK